MHMDNSDATSNEVRPRDTVAGFFPGVFSVIRPVLASQSRRFVGVQQVKVLGPRFFTSPQGWWPNQASWGLR